MGIFGKDKDEGQSVKSKSSGVIAQCSLCNEYFYIEQLREMKYKESPSNAEQLVFVCGDCMAEVDDKE